MAISMLLPNKTAKQRRTGMIRGNPMVDGRRQLRSFTLAAPLRGLYEAKPILKMTSCRHRSRIREREPRRVDGTAGAWTGCRVTFPAPARWQGIPAK